MLSLLFSVSDVLEMVLNILEALALLVSGCTVIFLMFNQYSRMLREVLGPCGMSLVPRLQALVLCRRSPVKKRAFVEFALLKTQGHTVIPAEWHSILNQFRAFYDEGNDELVFSVPNCTTLIGEPLAQGIERYFCVLCRPATRKAFGVRDDSMRWVLTLHIIEAYTTPTCLLTGLLSTYEENWSEFIQRYVSTAYISESDQGSSNDILTSELYFTFAWLLWGPSYELAYRNYWAGLCQLSYGDESNSVPAIANPETGLSSCLASLLDKERSRRYGVLLSADLSIYESRTFYKKLRDNINPDNAYFYRKAAQGPLPFALRIDRFSPCESYKAKKYYCTAYVWLLFELEDADNSMFRPEKCVAFFEHANLTDRDSYQFLVGTLVEKCIRHFSQVFERPSLEGRRYRFVCAMNEEIANRFRQRYKEITTANPQAESFRQRLLIEPRHTPTQAFSAFDDFFTPHRELHFEEVDRRNRATLAALGEFYTDIYMECFPDPDERESFDNLLGYLEQAQGQSDYRYHILLARDEEKQIVGGGIFDYFPDTNAAVIEFLAIRPDSQSGGIGSRLYRKIQDVLGQDACAAGKRQPEFIFCEIDSPQHSMASIMKYLYFWDKHHYRRLDFHYIQPSLSPQQAPVTGLWLTVSPQSGHTGTLSGDYALRVIADYMRYAMQISDPFSHPDYQRMANELRGKAQLGMLPIL